jgi:L-ascorbate metabolism protein UlaG (beta-lactamase superfamily)
LKEVTVRIRGRRRGRDIDGSDRKNPRDLMAWSMRITWYGHAAFLIETGGLRVILDPYRSPDSGGYEPIAEPADVVVVSHENVRYHSHLGQIVPPFEVVRALEVPPGGSTIRGLHIEAVHVFETPARLPEDEVTVIHFRAEGMHLVFLGDLGHALVESEVSQLRGAEIVLAAAGGPPTIDFPEIPGLIDAIGPRLILPMHYKTPRIDLNIQPVERFLDVLPGVPVDRPGRTWVEVNPETIPEERRIVVLEHAR